MVGRKRGVECFCATCLPELTALSTSWERYSRGYSHTPLEIFGVSTYGRDAVGGILFYTRGRGDEGSSKVAPFNARISGISQERKTDIAAMAVRGGSITSQ